MSSIFDEEKLLPRVRKPRPPASARQSAGVWIGEGIPGQNPSQTRSQGRQSPRRRETHLTGMERTRRLRRVVRVQKSGNNLALPKLAKILGEAESEAHFQTRVIKAAKLLGWLLVYHTWDSRRSPSGFPDLVMINERQHRHLFVELKTQRGRLTRAQERWRDGLLAVGCEWHCWRPMDWDALVVVLRGKR